MQVPTGLRLRIQYCVVEDSRGRCLALTRPRQHQLAQAAAMLWMVRVTTSIVMTQDLVAESTLVRAETGAKLFKAPLYLVVD